VLNSAASFGPARSRRVTSGRHAAAINEVQSLGSEGPHHQHHPSSRADRQVWHPPIRLLEPDRRRGRRRRTTATCDDRAPVRGSNLRLTPLGGALRAKYTRSALAAVTGDPPRRTPTATRHGRRPRNGLDASRQTRPPTPRPGAHSPNQAGEVPDVLASFFGDQKIFSVTSPTLPGVTRFFDNLSAAANEAGSAASTPGAAHTLDHTAGLRFGTTSPTSSSTTQC